jgi:phage gpG-like protein
MADVSFKIDEDGRARKLFERAIAAMKDFRPGLALIRDYQMKEISKQFSSGGSNILGSKWPKRKSSKFSHPLLVLSGKMKSGFSQKQLDSNRLVIGNDVKYYKYHQAGTRKMPRRQMAGHSNTMIGKSLDILSAYIEKKVKNG